jgi:hypothetical protein
MLSSRYSSWNTGEWGREKTQREKKTPKEGVAAEGQNKEEQKQKLDAYCAANAEKTEKERSVVTLSHVRA